jgi:hypothetical protein
MKLGKLPDKNFFAIVKNGKAQIYVRVTHYAGQVKVRKIFFSDYAWDDRCLDGMINKVSEEILEMDQQVFPIKTDLIRIPRPF